MITRLLILFTYLFTWSGLNAQTPLALSMEKTDITCNGANNGTGSANASGGLQPYHYNWSNGATTQSVSNLAPGLYSCTVTDDTDATVSGNIVIIQPEAISFTTAQTNVTCNGSATGSATVTASGGTTPYSYSWSNGSTSSFTDNLIAGTYTCTITDANGCDTSASVTITEPILISFNISQTNISCNGSTDGTATVNVSGGTGPYTYNWLPQGGTGATASNLPPGNYTCTITDANGCDTTANITITEPLQLSFTFTQTNVLCNGAATGTASVTVSGGTTPYSYNWSNGATTAEITNITAGSYTCTITDANGCDTAVAITITEPTAISFTTDQTNILCNGAATGSASVTVSDGIAPYTYLWGNGETTPLINNLTAGTYTCTITDANGCNTTATITITQTDAISFNLSQTNVSCNGGSNGTATVNVSGGTGPYTYSWFPAGGTGATANNLKAGIYNCTITDANACDTTAIITITEPSLLSFTKSQTDVLCNGAATGSATITVSGGVSPYTYNWSNGGTTAIINNIVAGTYTCIITDANGCDTSASVTITEASVISFTPSQTNVQCKGAATGAAGVTVSGGLLPYTYNWSNGETSSSISNLTAGTYTCTITDANGCDTTASITITETGAITFITTKTDVLCNGSNTGSASVFVTEGGTAPYSYSWSPFGGTDATANNLTAGTYTCTITDINGCDTTATVTITEPTLISFTSTQTNILCYGSATGAASVTVSGGVSPYTYNWSNGETSSSINNVIAGTYTCTITDANGCDTIASITITQLDPITFTTTQTNVFCNGGSAGSATVTVSGGGKAPYTYIWSPFGGTASTANGLSAGDYTCTVTDANGCDTIINFIITQPDALLADATKTEITCNGANDGSVTAVVSGGVPPYAYKWSPGGETTITITNLGPGTYTCTATDANGCIITGTASLVEPTLLTASSSHTDITCNGGNDGTASAATSGGTAPYTYSWSNSGTTATIDNLAAGLYTCTIIDARGCEVTTSTTVAEPSPVSATTSTIDVSCNGLTDGSATVNPSGGTPPYTYLWSNGGTTQTINNLAPGNYTVTVTDKNGCTFDLTTPAVVGEPAPLAVTTTQKNVDCSGEKTGIARAIVTGGTAPYSYQWSPSGGTGAIATGLGTGTYTCDITDAHGCTISTTVTITENTSLSFTTTISNVSCKGARDGSITANPSGGVAPYSYSWTPGGATTATISNLRPGTYTCIVTDSAGCKVIQTVEITEPAILKTQIDAFTNVTCNGAADGTATASATGGTAPYTYNWSPSGGTASTATNLSPGSYTCTITDANGCTATTTAAVITEQGVLEANVTYTFISSCGVNDGTATANPTGGHPPYSYSWSPGGQTTASITGLASGSYTCTVTDANGCTSIETITIPVCGDWGVTASKTDVTCNGLGDGTATAYAGGGTPPYTYSWSPGGQTTATITNLAPGTYTCTVSDAGSNTNDVSVTIEGPAEITASVTIDSISCHGGTGAATVTAQGGTLPYTYLWSNGATTAKVENLTAGTYTCTITDAHNCSETVSDIIITEPSLFTIIPDVTNVHCNGLHDGIIALAVVGGTTPYSYSWSPSGGTGPIATGLTAGVYTCIITDANGCDTTINITVTEPEPLAASATKTDVTCHGADDGTAAAIITGGTTPYFYSWDPNGEPTAFINNLSPGTYTCNVTDFNGCKIIGTVEITQPTVLVATSTVTNASCYGASDGSATVTASGGTKPYTYTWATGATTQTITNMQRGSYSCIVTDSNGCIAYITAIIGEPQPVSAGISEKDASCNDGADGSITLSGTGGTAPYTYSWSNGGTTATIDNLEAGVYICTITDANNCTGTVTVVVRQPLALAVVASQTNVSCNGNKDGIASVQIIGGTAPYAYNWLPSGGTGATATGLPAGVYTCTITDENGCTITDTVTITEPDVLTVDVNQVNVSCKGLADGTVTLVPKGGTPPYSYIWSTGDTTATVNNLSPGTHTCDVKDANGCGVLKTIEITEPGALTASSSHTDVLCNEGSDGTVTATPAGGTAPYTYLWLPGGATTATVTGLISGTYTCTITDAHGCTTTTTTTVGHPSALGITVAHTNVTCNGAGNGTAGITASGGTAPYSYSWSTGAVTSSISNLSPGIYFCTIADKNGCDTIVTVLITQPSALSFTTSQSNALCNGGSSGSATVTPAGGTPPYSYSWSPSGGTDSIATGLTAGTYTCTITDANGCDTTATVVISQPSALSFSVANTNVSCNGGDNGTAAVVPSGGTGPYTYLWSNGATTPLITNLTAGSYTCTITDANDCNTTASVTITEPGLISFTTSQTNVSCNGGNTGSASVNASGGTAPYNYSWSNGATTPFINNLIAGTYTCTITDANGCDTTASITITEPSALTAGITAKTNVSCNGGNTGSATVTPAGGTAPYTYSWSPGGSTDPTATGLTAGVYVCLVTDAHGCVTTAIAAITQPALISFTTSQTNVACNGGNDGSATVNLSGGTSPYNYSWSNGDVTATANNLTAGTYTCTITDANGCDTTASVIITETSALAVTTSQINVSCNGGNNGSATVNVTGGTAPYTYLWGSGATTATINNLAAGTYTCTITDAHGCDTTASVVITQPDVISFTTAQTNVACNGGNTGSATVTVGGGTAPYSYLWSNGATTAMIDNLAAGTYSCFITDANGCVTVFSITITQPAALSFTTSQTNVACNSNNTGSATVNVTGGTTPYNYDWSNGETTPTINDLTAGAYTCTITDANGCDTAVTITITEASSITFTTSQTDVNCNGGNTGSATVDVSGGTAPYTYAWSNGGTTATIDNLTAGTYTCTITDANGCTATASVTITEASLITFTTAQTNVLCNGDNTGSASVTVDGGTSPYTYQWSNGATTSTIDNLTTGTYSCLVTDASGCDTTFSIIITEPDAITFTTSQTNVDCNGNNTGSATVTVSGGRRPYTYLWSNGGTTATIDNLTAGTYTCAITDANGCDTTASIAITQPDGLSFTTSQTDVNCNGGNTGSATADVSGGVTPYTYAWSNGGTTATITNLTAGTYTCTITDANGCTASASVTITEATLITFTTSQVNVNCNGGNTGSATVTVSGGVSPYTYLWSNGATTATIDNLTAGTYSCLVTDANGCDTTFSITITEPTLITFTTSQVNVGCNGGNTGSATVDVSGGVTPYTYLWSNGGTTSTIDNLTTGTYTCTITDANGCDTTASVTITEASLITFTTSQVNVACNGGNTGSATVTVSGGVSPYTYLWSNGGTTSTIDNLTTGTYTCTITDANGCDTTASVTITEASLITFTTSQVNVACNGGNTGSATVTVSGGVSPYTYLWSNSATTATIDNLTAGTYTCTITDANGCDTTASVTITEASLITFTTSQINVGCNGGNTGSASVDVSGGVTPYTYLWSNGGTTSTIDNLTAGTYTCTITDANGCDTTASVTITEASLLTATIGSQANVSCNGGNDGAATVIPSGGTVPYSFSWSPTGGTASTATGLTAGTYTCTITDGNGCTTTVPVTITEPAALSFTTSQVNVACNGGNTGSATVDVTGGTAPYTYLWSNGETTSTISNLTAGTYTCTITDAHSCVTTASVTITEATALAVTTSQTNVNCNGGNTGSATADVSGGTAPYTYLWSNGETTSTISNLTAGTYTCTITDANGCTATASVTITEASLITFTTSQVNVNCNGGNTGSATVTVSGGVSPYTYLWSNGATTATIDNLTAGTYSCLVTDANGCDTTFSITITEPTLITFTTSQVNVGCNGGNTGSATVDVSGGVTPYTYLWSNGGTTSTIDNLTTGTYTCTITDANGCDTTASVTITEASLITFTTSQVNVACNGGNTGSATVTVSGGVSPYTYLWSNSATTATIDNLTAGTYTCTITDANGCDTTASVTITEASLITFTTSQINVGCNGGNTGSASVDVSGGVTPYTYLWSNGATTATIDNLTAGTYSCLVTDANGCDTTFSITITEPTLITFTTSQVNVGCNGGNTGSATVDVSGGVTPYTYLWSNGGTTSTIDNLTTGTYTCTITDANGCDTTASVTITEASLITFTTSQVNVACNGGNTGSATVTVSGGVSPYTYLWSNSATTATIDNLTAGTYTCTITDANGCDTTASVTITEASLITFTTSQINVGCNGGNTGSASVDVSGGVTPYTYLWSNGGTTSTIDNLTAGTYTCTITDANGCDTTASVTITEASLLTATIGSQANVSCNGGNDGAATVIPSGGTVPYSFSWSPTGGTASTATGLTAGTYTCTITDGNGCTTTVPVTITEPAALSFTTSQVNVACNGGNTGSATVDVTGGTAPYTYLWSNGETTSTISNLTAGTYTCTITDAHSCVTTASVTITEATALAVTTSQTNVNCNGGNTGSATADVSGGTAPYTYLWSNGETTSTISNLTAGTYTCTITDANGCTATASVTITEASLITFTTSQVNVNCNGGNTGSATVTVSGGVSPYTYLWSNGATTATIDNLTAGTYSCLVTDANGCDTTFSITITEPTLITFTTSQVNVGCNGGNTGSATVDVSGGVTPYTYLWSNGGTTSTIDNLTTGTYTCTITDANGCDTTASVTITEASLITFTTSQVNVACNGGNTGSATVTVSGGVSPYTYLWSNSATTATIDNLTAGTYTCTITDANGCDTTASVTITEASLITFTTSQINVGCNGGNTGSASVDVSGGVTPYTYLWSNGGTTSTIDNLTAGTYTCTITDANGCDTTASVTITEASLLTATIGSQANVSCNGGNDGAATVIPSGGTVPYSFSWSPTGGTASTATGLTAGTYTCTITDGNGCTTTVPVTITEPAALSFTTSQVNVACNGGNTGSATVDVTGGTAPYTYLWSNGETTSTISNLTAGTYTCTITDAHSCVTTASVTITEATALAVTTSQTNVNCNGGNTGSATADVSGGTAPYTYLWSNGETTSTISNLTAGTYTCTITDANGCTATASVTITEASLITFTTSQVNVNCNGGNTGSATVTVSGGVSPYTYLWSNGATTATIDNLTAGTYSCLVTDANGCDTTFSITITEPTLITFTTSQVNVGCNGGNTGSATVDVSGGVTPYTYLWSNGGTTSTIDNLTTGTYTCTITDANGCDTTASVTITEASLITFTTSQVNVACNGGNTGSATVTVSGGVSPYTYLWSNSATTATIDNLTAGTYTCTITDANGCDTTASVTITEATALAVATTQTNIGCSGSNTGLATVTVKGGTAPYSYMWGNGATTATINNLAVGTYICTVTDANGCDTTVSATITQSAALDIITTQTNVNCNGAATGSATVIVTGGTAPYNYLWSNGATIAPISNLSAGTYTCTVTDANGCTGTARVTITEVPALVVTTTQTNVLCNSGNTGSATVTVTGGTDPYNYLWSNGATTATITGLAAGTYTCTVTDANGCDTTASVTIIGTSSIVVTTTETNVTCNGGNTGSTTITVTNGTAPYTYLWSNGATTATISNLTAGTYSCIVTDANGCSAATSVNITEAPALIVTTAQTGIGCNGTATGSEKVTVTGGTAPYSYLWSNGSTTPTVGGLAAGTYTCTISDANGCDTKVTVNIKADNFETSKAVYDADGDGRVEANELLIYTIRVKNTGSAAIDSILISDPVPQHTNFVSSDEGSLDNNIVSFTDVGLEANQERVYSFIVRADEDLGGTAFIINTADVKISADAVANCIENPRVSIAVKQQPPPSTNVDLAITKQSEQKAITVGDMYEYTITVSNAQTTAHPVIITDTLPGQITYISNNASAGVANYNANTRVLIWQIDSLHDGEIETLTLKVRADEFATVINTAYVTSPQDDIDMTNNISTDSKEVIPFKIPNVFTPNGDGKNETFFIKGLNLYAENELLVFNRWNANVFQEKNYHNEWNGSNLNEGTYFYILRLKDNNGQWHEYKGNVLILRH